MKVAGIIPVRLESSRLPEKALADICGLPMIGHTYCRARMSRALDELYVATDSERIKAVVEGFGGRVIMTSRAHKTGSDRIAEAASQIDADIIVNIQGDEPLLNPDHVTRAVDALEADPAVQVAVLVTPYEVKNSGSDIKAVLDLHDFIMYCSRTDLPSAARTPVRTMWKMSFIVPFRKDFLFQYTAWPQTPLEKIEFNEYLRILENGHKIKAVRVEHADISVDTPADLEIVRGLMLQDKLVEQYRKGCA